METKCHQDIHESRCSEIEYDQAAMLCINQHGPAGMVVQGIPRQSKLWLGLGRMTHSEGPPLSTR